MLEAEQLSAQHDFSTEAGMVQGRGSNSGPGFSNQGDDEDSRTSDENKAIKNN